MSKDFRCPKCVSAHGMMENIPKFLDEVHCVHSMPDERELEIKHLQSRLTSAVEALRFYATKENWTEIPDPHTWGVYFACDQFGLHPFPWDKAQEALAKIEEKE